MDSGVLNEGESLDEEYDVTRGLLPEEILGIIDQLLCLEVSVPEKTRWCAGVYILMLSIDSMASRIPIIADNIDERLCRGFNESSSCNYRRGKFYENTPWSAWGTIS